MTLQLLFFALMGTGKTLIGRGRVVLRVVFAVHTATQRVVKQTELATRKIAVLEIIIKTCIYLNEFLLMGAAETEFHFHTIAIYCLTLFLISNILL